MENLYREAKERFDDFKKDKTCFTEEEIVIYNELKHDMDWWLSMLLFSIESQSQIKWAKERERKKELDREIRRRNTLLGRLFG